MNIKTILNPLFGKVMKDGKRIPDTRIMVFGTRIFFEDYLLPDDTIVCTDWADFISMRMRGKYNHVEFLSESDIKNMVSEEKLYNYMERKYDMKKFDLVVSNPPYDGDLHLQILNEFMKIGKKCVFIHPGRWVEDILAKYKGKNATGRKYEHLKKMLTKVMMIKQKDGCKLFNILLPQDMMIGVYENGKDNGGILPIYEDSDMFFDVLEKILNYAHNVKSLGDMGESKQIEGIRVEVKEIQASNKFSNTETNRQYDVRLVENQVIDNGYVGGLFWSSTRRKCGNAKEEGTPIPYSIKFDNAIAAQAFIDLYRTNVVKNIIYMLKYDQNAGHTHIPYFDPNTIKTEDDVLDALGITNEEHRNWLKRDVYDYREKDFIKYGEWIDC